MFFTYSDGGQPPKKRLVEAGGTEHKGTRCLSGNNPFQITVTVRIKYTKGDTALKDRIRLSLHSKGLNKGYLTEQISNTHLLGCVCLTRTDRTISFPFGSEILICEDQGSG